MIKLVKTVFVVGIAGSAGAFADVASVYQCLETENGKAIPRLACSDFEARRAFLAIQKHFTKGRIDEGLALLEILVSAKPFNTEFRMDLIEKKIRFSKLDGTERHLDVLAKLDPNSESVTLLVAKGWDATGKLDEAIALLSEWIDKQPTGYLELRRLRAQLFEKKEKWNQARTDWHIVERARLPTEERVHRLKASLEQKQFEAVRKECEALLNREDATFDPTIGDFLAQAYFGAQNYSDAEAMWKKVLERSSDEHDVRVRLSKALIEQKRYEEAVLQLNHVLGMVPGHRGAIYQMTRVRILQKRFDLAGQTLARLTQLDQQSTWTVKAQAELWNSLGENDLAQSTLAAASMESVELKSAAIASETETKQRAIAEAGCVEHAVARGETLEAIAYKYFQDRQAWPFIVDSNAKAVSDPRKIREGTVLMIPPSKEAAKCGQ